MTPGTIGGNVRIEGRPGLRLVPGETIALNVIKSLGGNRWAVGIRGRVYPAVSDLPLESGAMLRARVRAEAGRMVLALSRSPSDAVRAALRAALRAQGIPAGDLAELIAQGLARSGLPITARTVERAASLLSRTRLDPRKGARIVATLIDKKVDLASPGIEALLAVLAFGEKGGEDPRRYRGRKFPDSAPGVKEFTATLPADSNEKPAGLQVYNHLHGASQTWVVVPFLFGSGPERLAGTLKILYDPFLARPLRLALTAGGISFHLPLETHGAGSRARKRRTLSVYCDDAVLQRAVSRGLDRLKAKFHNMGMEVDDTIHKGDAFDGFSPADEGMPLHGVDTVG
jgi:hypothetical protein